MEIESGAYRDPKTGEYVWTDITPIREHLKEDFNDKKENKKKIKLFNKKKKAKK